MLVIPLEGLARVGGGDPTAAVTVVAAVAAAVTAARSLASVRMLHMADDRVSGGWRSGRRSRSSASWFTALQDEPADPRSRSRRRPVDVSTASMAFPLGLDSTERGPDQTLVASLRSCVSLIPTSPRLSSQISVTRCTARHTTPRGHGANALDQFSPYLSEAARKSLLQRNPNGLQEVKGIIIGGMRIADMHGLETPHR